MRLGTSLAAGLAALAFAGAALAGAEKVGYPAGYQTKFRLYNVIDRPDRKIVRFMYMNPEAFEKAKAGEPAPHGMVLVMEDRKAKTDASGKAVTDAEGRIVATDEVANVFVMRKEAGWGAEYPPEKRNGEWEYAWFTPDGARKADARFDGCFSCHKARAERDFTFTFAVNLGELKK
ncbi:MAG: cytochrome P460 family protein [Proteobacteria bacterium]|nr:cytochrome P460 family protein [Pseudomonadota bacterium]